jgi:Mor family transcriptional regulator
MGTKIIRKDLSEAMQEIYDCIGSESFIKLVRQYGGGFIYVATEQSIMRCSRNRQIKDMLRKGSNYKEIAKQLGLSQSWVRRLHKNSRSKILNG